MFFQREEIDWLFVRLAVNPNVGDRVQPLTRGGIECIQAMRQYQSVEEILFYVPDTGFDAAFGENYALQIVEVSAQEFSLSHTLSIL